MTDHPFDYKKPDAFEQDQLAIFGTSIKATYDALLGCAPGSAERTLAIRKLQEARMWANVAILGIGELPR